MGCPIELPCVCDQNNARDRSARVRVQYRSRELSTGCIVCITVATWQQREHRVGMWPDYLDNPQAIHSAFPNAIPELKGLRPGRLVIDFAGTIWLGLNVQPLPDGGPSRWREEGNDGLEYRFVFYDTSDLSIFGTTQHLGQGVTLDLHKGAASLFSQDRAFCASFMFRGARLSLRAFSGVRRLDAQDF
jgi:hypothetical protein